MPFRRAAKSPRTRIAWAHKRAAAPSRPVHPARPPRAPPAGAPPTNTTFYCSKTTAHCYLYVATGASNAAANTTCLGKGMALVTYDSAEEQLEVENSIVPSSTDYW
jgi:hypothetical protein